MLRMDAIFLCFILRPSMKAPTSALQRSPAALRKAASIGDGWDGEDALPWANRCPVYVILQTAKQLLYNVSHNDPCVASNAGAALRRPARNAYAITVNFSRFGWGLTRCEGSDSSQSEQAENFSARLIPRY